MMGYWTESVGIKGEDEDVHKTEPLQTQHDQIIVKRWKKHYCVYFFMSR